MNKKAILIILDGWGKGRHDQSNAIWNAQTPFMSGLMQNPDIAVNQLHASGEDVGLPNGQMGNSEVGHLNIGAGRVVYQDLVRINKAIEDNSIANNPELIAAFKYARENQKAVHFIGLVSDGGVHSSTHHLMKLCDVAQQNELDKVYIHALTDGRDTDPRSGLGYVKKLEHHLKNSAGQIASVCGRYYTMDRDKRWERVKSGYDLLVHGKGTAYKSACEAIEAAYATDVTDEFIQPAVMVNETGAPLATIQPNDVVICFNFRTDRLREITTVLSQQDMPEFDMQTRPLYYVTMARYDENFKQVNVLFDKADLPMTLGEVIAKAGKKQIRIAETEKYAHVTFFFNGGREQAFEGEQRILIPSPKVATYDLQPEMSAPQVKTAIVEELKKGSADFVCLNFANADMVGHTGIFPAIKKAVETVDQCVKEVVTTATANNYSVVIIADHGNADYALNEDGTANTAHSTNPVPLILIDENYKQIREGRLCDVAPTILKVMGMDIPEEMNGQILV